MTSRMALSATAFTVPSGFWMLKRKSAEPFGLIRHSTVKSTSTMFSSPVSIRLSSGTSRMVRLRRGRIVDQRHADRDGGEAQRLRQLHRLHRPGQMIIEAGVGIANIFAEALDDALFFRLYAVETGQSPDRDGGRQQQGDAHAGEIAARQPLLQALLSAPQEVLEIGRARPHGLRAGAPWSLRTGAPRATALVSKASTLSFAGIFRAQSARPSLVRQPYKGRPVPLQCRPRLHGAKLRPLFVKLNIVKCG